MDVALATDGLGIPQTLCHPLDRRCYVTFGGGRCIEVFEFLQRLSGERCSGPCPKILGCKVLAADSPQVLVDVGRPDIMNSALFVDELEKLLPGKLLTPPDDPGEFGISDVDVMIYSAFAVELKAGFRSGDLEVT